MLSQRQVERCYEVGDKIRRQPLLEAENVALKSEVASFEQVLKETREGLTAAPKEGAAWDKTLAYTTGMTATFDGKTYEALRFSRGNQPDISPEHWAVKIVEAAPLVWLDLDSGHAFVVGDKVTHIGLTFACIKAHTKSTVRQPLDGSQWWEVAV